MSNVFRDLLKKIGSGTHTSQSLSREESAQATCMMLNQTATPAQIGAFMIAQRIKRPTIEELAGMLDGYDRLGGRLTVPPGTQPVEGTQQPSGGTIPFVLNAPYDGRKRTAPVTPLTALILATAGVPAILHGGDRMPTKMGLPFIEIWRSLGLDWHLLTLDQTQQVFEQTRVGFVYLPQHFPLAQGLVPYREQIGKRPTLATVELMWVPCQGIVHGVSSFVHPPTELRTQQTYWLRNMRPFTTVKGLEGSCDLPRSRTAIIGLGATVGETFERLLLHPRDYGFGGEDPPLTEDFSATLTQSILGKSNELTRSGIWNGGFYLWRSGVVNTLEQGFQQAQTLLETGQVQAKYEQIKVAIATSLTNQLSTV